MEKQTFYYLSADGKTKIHAVRWIPEGKVQAVLQIAHGMAEYVERYEDFAQKMNQAGLCVTGNDHLGHGQSVTDLSRLGFFSEKNGNRNVLQDMLELQKITRKEYSDVPCFLLGHSMGSFLCRQYIADYGDELAGAIVMGTGQQPAAVTAFAKEFCRIVAAVKGPQYRSGFINSLAFGGYNKRFGEKGKADWLNTRKECVEKYEQDPLCGFMFTVGAYYDLFESIHRASGASCMAKTPADLPVLVVSGADDPVGDFGKAPAVVAEKLKQAGVKDVELKLYPGDRHEILAEKDCDTVCKDILNWIRSKV